MCFDSLLADRQGIELFRKYLENVQDKQGTKLIGMWLIYEGKFIKILKSQRLPNPLPNLLPNLLPYLLPNPLPKPLPGPLPNSVPKPLWRYPARFPARNHTRYRTKYFIN